MAWICEKVDSNGNRCTANAVCRLQFSKDHPFEHFDVCEEHLSEYTDYLWTQEIDEFNKIQELYKEKQNALRK